MNPYRNMSIRQRWFAVLLALTAIILLAKGGYMQAKAHFAQFLIERAWDNTLEDRQVHKPWSWADTYPVAKIHFVDAGGKGSDDVLYVLAGASGRNLAFGPSAILTDNQINVWGNTVIAGHRDTHFARLSQIRHGQLIRVQDASSQELNYRVMSTKIVDQSDTLLLRQDDELRLTLVTCYPFDSLSSVSRQRFVVVAEPVDSGNALRAYWPVTSAQAQLALDGHDAVSA